MERERLFSLVSLMLLSLNEMVRTIMIIPAPPSNPVLSRTERLRFTSLALPFLAQLLALVTSVLPPTYTQLSLRDRLLPDFHGHNFQGRDVFSMIREQKYLFWLNTGETPETFLQVVAEVAPALNMITRQGNLRRRVGRFKLDIVNRILLLYIWLRKYPHLDSLSLMFDVSPQTVSALIYQGIIVLWRYFRSKVTWPTNREWNEMRNKWQQFPNAVGCIDVTPHEILVPSTEPQRHFYSGHRHFHLLNTQMICDNNGHIRFLQAGFLGSTHDAQSFRLMEPIRPGMTLDIPIDVVFLADKGYPDVPPLLTPFRQNQIRAMRNNRDKRKARRFNRELSRKRVKIEHIFKNLKDFRCVSSIWRQQRWLLPVVIELCAYLTERHLSLFEEI